ncbi:YbjN domain-containing protein [Haliangium ochraceum]|uniref:Tir chaperone family protein n=1 Tax=Haliangium ochraceum (strain DSM 14365 / JCM 11303 / SMP-2) TaxID=502025 RepID=D0LWY9_HALO1|nr:YbjN domain-containing protein [Haliangium ochraceum]ACY14236.1 hypothetical protein Hoch_1686 [Haliangium ochraceum DSM 14365]
MDTISKFDDLAAFFSKSGLQHQADSDQSVVQIPTRNGPLEGAMFIRWDTNQKVVHFVQTMNITLTDERMADLALAVAILNHALPLPGFGINVGERQCYFRISMPFRPDGTLSEKEIQGLFNHAVGTATQHLPTLRDVAENGAEPMKILEQTSV